MILLDKFYSSKNAGAALFATVLLTMTLSVIAAASMARLSETAHTTGKDLQERRLTIYAQSAVNIVNGEIQKMIDEQLDYAEFYFVNGPGGKDSFQYYPRDVVAAYGATPSLFGYRAVAKRFASQGDTPPGLKDELEGETCYDILVDVREVYLLAGGNIASDKESRTPVPQYFLGKMKTIGAISCFTKGEN